jgi:hypothetical protein
MDGLSADPATSEERRVPDHRASSFAMVRRRRKGRRFLVTFWRCCQKVTRLQAEIHDLITGKQTQRLTLIPGTRPPAQRSHSYRVTIKE